MRLCAYGGGKGWSCVSGSVWEGASNQFAALMATLGIKVGGFLNEAFFLLSKGFASSLKLSLSGFSAVLSLYQGKNVFSLGSNCSRGVGSFLVSVSPVVPAFDNSCVVPEEDEFALRERDRGNSIDQELKADSLCPADVSLSIPSFLVGG